MEIRIKTAEEFRDSHVTIEIVAADAGEASDIAQSIGDGVLSNDRVRLDIAQREVKELKAELERQRKITRDLEGHYQRKLAEAKERYAQLEQSRDADLKVMDERAERLIARANELEIDLAAITQQRDAFKTQAYEQNDRAAELRQTIKALGEQHQRELEDVRTAHNATRNRVETVTRAREEAERRIRETRELLAAEEVAQARQMCVSGIANTMGHAIGAAIRVLDRA